MTETYGIARLVAGAYLAERGMEALPEPFSCPEGTADIVASDGDATVLVELSCKSLRGEPREPKINADRLRRIAACYLVENPGVDRLRFDVLEVLVGAGHTARLAHAVAAYEWER